MSLVINFPTGAPPMPASPAAETPPATGVGFGELLAGLWEREADGGGFMGDRTASPVGPAEASAKPVAEVFDQHGLFAQELAPVVLASAGAMPVPVQNQLPDIAAGSAATMPDQIDISSTVAQAASGAASRPPLAPVSSPQPYFAGAGAGASASAVAPPAFDAALAVKEAIAVPAGPRFSAPVAVWKATSLFVGSTIATGATASDTPEEPDASRSPIIHRDTAEDGATSDVIVTLQTAEQGAVVAARVAERGMQGRVRLRERIGALLARYGLRARDVRLNGAPLTADTSRSEEV